METVRASRPHVATAAAAGLGIIALGVLGTGRDPEMMALRLLPVIVLAGGVVSYAARKKDGWYRGATIIAFGTVLILYGGIGATSFTGTDDHHPKDLYYVAVMATLVTGSILTRFAADGMSRVLFGTAVVQMTVAVAAFATAPAGSVGPGAFVHFMLLNAFFAGLFAASGMLFRRSTRARAR